MNKAASILSEAAGLVAGDRNKDYGDIVVNNKRIAEFWTVYLKAAGKPANIEAQDVATMMALLKVARECHKHKEDNLVDAAGYIGLAGEIAYRERTD